MTMLDQALAYAARGWPVFPCDWRSGPKEKVPLVPRDKDSAGRRIDGTGGVAKATTAPEVIKGWWSKWPLALIGVALGSKAGLWVVDFDPRGETVDAVEQRFNERVGTLPRGPVSRTQSGGRHSWLKMPPGEIPKNSVKRIHNVDWRAQGGYVIVPPSVMSNGAKYEWIISPDEAEFPEAPARLLDLVFKRGEFAPAKRDLGPVSHDAPAEEAVRHYCEIALAKSCDRVVALVAGQRNSEFNNIALSVGHMVGAGGLTMSEAHAALRDAALTWGIGDDDKALKPGGTLERALADGAREPMNVSHIRGRGRRPPERQPEPRRVMETEPPHDAETGEIIEDHDPGADFPTDEPDHGEPDIGQPEPEPERPRKARHEAPFRYLGYNREFFYYLPDGKGQIVALRASEHTPLRLIEIAPLSYWQTMAGDGDKVSKEQWQACANGMMRQNEQAGIFDEDRLRGRGAWIDGKNVIVHTGSEAVINGQGVALNKVLSRYIYEAETPWDFGFGEPAKNAEAHRLVEICQRLTWADKLSGALLAGWCVVAPISGALNWRPHIWITGSSKSGKTTAVNDIVGRIVGPSAERFDGKTTEAAMRQTMGHDARPIILDEAEGEDQAGAQRMQGVLDLARVSSSGAVLSKGGANHKAVRFMVRSCFCFASINTSVRHHADESRVSKLVLVPNSAPDREAHYRDLTRDIATWFTPEYASMMFARTIKYLNVLLRNSEIFTMAAAEAFHSRRAADQLGPMLAGYYLCHSTGEITPEKAMKLIRDNDWGDFVALNSETDENRLFQYLMSRPLRVNGSAGSFETTIGAACDEARHEMGDRRKPYTAALGAKGIRVEDGMIAISDSAENTRALFKDQPQWQSDWKRPVQNLPGALRSPGGVRFSPGINTRATWIPYGLLDGSYLPREPGDDSDDD